MKITNKVIDRIVYLLNKRTFLVLVTIVIIGILVAIVPIYRMNRKVIATTAIQHAKLYTEILQEFRTLYTKEVISKIDQADVDITITHDFKDKPNAVPLPASMTILLGNIISEDSTNIAVKLYSPYPFPFRKKDRGLTDQFAKDSWEFFKTNPDEPFYRIEDINDEKVLRYAIADKMRPSCIQCHNTHPQTPVNNWKVNDVRGVLELNRPLGVAKEETSANMYSTMLLMLIMMLVFITLLILLITRLKEMNKDKESLLRETHHRVKNNFQIITSLLRLGTRGLEGSESFVILEEAEAKLRTMALLHERLYKTEDLEHIDVGEYLTDLVETLIENYTINVKIELDIKIETEELKLRTLVPLCLIINELISNSLKYAFTNRLNGRIIILMKKEKENYSLIIGDNGKGFSDKNGRHAGLGLELVNLFIEQLDATITHLDKEGTYFEIIIPSSNNP